MSEVEVMKIGMIMLLFGVAMLSGLAFADTYKTIYNPFTSRLDYVTKSFENLTINNSLIVNGSITALGNMTATWFRGMFNFTATAPWLTFDGGTLSFNSTQSDATYVNIDGDTMTGNLSLGTYNLTAGNVLADLNASYVQNEYWVDTAGDTMSGDLDMGAKNITTVDCVVFNSGGKICSAP